MSNDGGRLNLSVKPIHYDLIYDRIDFVNFNFFGTCKMHCKALKENETVIQLHALDVQLVKATLSVKSVDDDSTKSQQDAIQYHYHRRNQTVDIEFATPMIKDMEYVLSMDFIGVLNDQMCGLYRSVYKDVHGQDKIMATTQFEATDARRAFPCADEPALKATFQLTLKNIPAHMQCISNTPMAAFHTTLATNTSNNEASPVKTIVFQKTPKMSTYLLALVVAEFDGLSCTSNNIVTTVYTVPGKASQAEFCLDTASRCLDLFQEIFHVPYPLTKSDLLAIPDFAAGAMENWGCVTFREAKILVKPGSTSETMKRAIARTVCHELSHQWFGNLVTMEYWTQLYLKEGMARFMEFVGIDALFPEWDAWTEFVQSTAGLAMSLDAMKSSHPIEVEVNHPDEISEIFDSISYEKGASVVRMIASYVGMDVFLEGMRLYLTRHAYGNTVTNDLWQALEEVSGKPCVKFMQPWVLQMGYPILMLSEDGTINVERYLATGRESLSENGNTTMMPWPIPVTAKVEGMTEVQGPWVINGPAGDDLNLLIDKVKEWSSQSKWFKLNVNQTGFFRVAYSTEQFARLAKVMKPNGIQALSTADRLGLIADSFAAGKAGYSSIVDSLVLIENFGQHGRADYAVWQEISENLTALVTLFRSESFFGKLQSFIRKLYRPHLDRLGWEAQIGESSRGGTLRATIIEMLGIAEDPEVLEEAFDRFFAYKKDPIAAPIPGDLRLTVFRCALRHNEAVVFEALKEIYEETTFPEEQRNCLIAMGGVKHAERHGSMLDYVHKSGKVRYQDISLPLGSLSGTTDYGGKATWQYFVDNYDDLYSRHGSGPMWSACVAMSCRGVKTCEEADAVELFFDETIRPPGSAKRRLSQALEVVRIKAMRRERDRIAMEEYFSDKA